MYGDVGHHQVLPFAVEDGGALGNEAQRFFNRCKDICSNALSGIDAERQTWSAQGFSNFYYQSISVSNYRGLGYHLMTAGNIIRAHYGR